VIFFQKIGSIFTQIIRLIAEKNLSNLGQRTFKNRGDSDGQIWTKKDSKNRLFLSSIFQSIFLIKKSQRKNFAAQGAAINCCNVSSPFSRKKGAISPNFYPISKLRFLA
jgi:hypothetical protein